MLSPNTLLNKARYRVDSALCETPVWALYRAEAQLSKEAVLITERPGGEIIPAARLDHDGLMCIVETFTMNGRSYSVSEPASSSNEKAEARRTVDRFAVILMALNALEAAGRSNCLIDPTTVVVAKSGNQKLLALEPYPASSDVEAWNLPIDAVYEHLDYVSQRAIYNAWGENAVVALEHPTATPIQIYSLAAIFYKILTGVQPEGGFERTVAVLDGKDPLGDMNGIVSIGGHELAGFFARCLALRPEDRFQSFEGAILEFPTLPDLGNFEADHENELMDLLEIGEVVPGSRTTVSVLGEMESRAMLHVEPPAHPALAPDHFLSSPTALQGALRTVVNDDTPVFFAEIKQTGGLAKYVVFALFSVAAASLGGWWFMQTTDATGAVEMPVAALTLKPVVQETPSVASTPDVAAALEKPVASDATVSPPSARPGVPTRKTEVRTTANPAERLDSPAKSKKKVTVDDLINDN